MFNLSIAMEAKKTAYLLRPGIAFDRSGLAIVIGRLSIVATFGRAAVAIC
jgi:hypothetical protein